MNIPVIQRHDNLDYVIKVRANADAELNRESKKFTRGANKGQTKEFFTTVLEIAGSSAVIDGKKYQRIGLVGRIIIHNFWEHTDKHDFKAIQKALSELVPDEDGILMATEANEEVEIPLVVNGYFYTLPCKHYRLDENGDVDKEADPWEEIAFFMPAHRNSSMEAVERAFKREAQMLADEGRLVISEDDDLFDDDKGSRKEVEKEEAKEDKKEKEKKTGRNGRRNR